MSYFSLYHNLQFPERSNVIYFKVLDQKCYRKETVIIVRGAYNTKEKSGWYLKVTRKHTTIYS